jgi:hypothetical protein
VVKGSAATNARLVFLLWILVAFFYFYLSYDYIRITTNDQEFADYLHHVVQLAGNDRRPNKEIRALLLDKAAQLTLPVRGDQINVQGRGESLNINVAYEVDIEIPVLQRRVYTKRFEHKDEYQQGR